jgi:hypothetical protein
MPVHVVDEYEEFAGDVNRHPALIDNTLTSGDNGGMIGYAQ